MTYLDSIIYSELASRLMQQLDHKRDIFNGSVEYNDNDLSIKLTCTVIVYYKEVKENDSWVKLLENIVPVWWDCATYTENIAVYNDFSWAEFKQYILYGTNK